MRRSREPGPARGDAARGGPAWGDAARAGEVAPLARAAAWPAAWGLVGAGLVAFAVQLRFVWPFTADDAFITFRYAVNLASGAGPHFNVGDSRSEGFTSAGFLALTALVVRIGLDPAAFAKGFGVVCALATAALTARLARELDVAVDGEPSSSDGSGRALLAAAFAAFAWLGFHATAVHAASGMETLLACALVAALARGAFRVQRGLAAPGPALGLLALALGLVRPELNVAAAVLLGLTFVATPAAGVRRGLVRSVLLFWWIPGAVFFAARALYYGHLLPIPFYAKVAGGVLAPGAPNALLLARVLLASVGLFAVWPLVAAPRALAAIAGTALAIVLLALLPDPVMDFDFRYAMPALPLVFALAGVGFAWLAELAVGALAGAHARRARAAAVLFTVLVAGGLAAAAWEPAFVALRERRAYGLALEAANVRLGRVLAEFEPTDGRAPLLALGDAGAIPFHSGWRTIDTFSLNDPAIAIEGRHDPEYVLDQEPDVLIVVSTTGPEFRAHWANVHDPGLFAVGRARGLRPAVIVPFSAASYFYVMTKPESEIERHLRRVFLPEAPAS